MARLLIVARNVDLLEAVQQRLTDLGHTALVADSVPRALELLQGTPFAAALIESVPPKLTVFKLVREEAVRRGLPWIALSSGPVPPGATEVLKMPFNLDELDAAVARVLPGT